MRFAIVVLLAACEPNLAVKPLPELVAAPQPTAASATRPLLLIPGETMIWDVHFGGFTVARAELVVGDHEVSSRVTTGKLASSLASLFYEATSEVDRTHAIALRETMTIDGDTTRAAARFRGATYLVDDKPHAVPGGNVGHTIHSALGWLRAWAEPGAAGGYLYVVHVGELYKLEFAEPIVEEDRFRIECRIAHPEGPVSITIWLTADRDRVPARIAISNPNVRLTAELVDRSKL